MTENRLRPWSRLVPAVLLLLLSTGLLSVPAVAQEEAVSAANLAPYTERVPTGFINWGEGFAEVRVEAMFDTARFGASHAKIRAIEDAEAKSAEALYRLLRGINVSGDLRIAGSEAMEEALRTTIRKHRNMGDKSYANVSMWAMFQVPLFGKKNLADMIYATAWEEPAAGTLPVDGGGAHSSVVFDASGTSLQAALYPRFLTEEGEVLFGPANYDLKALSRTSPVTYVVRSADTGKGSGLSKTLARELGDNPLVVKVGKIAGDFLADIVLSPEQVEELRQASAGGIMAAGRIFILQAGSVDVTKTSTADAGKK
jgi:hypothetical protein